MDFKGLPDARAKALLRIISERWDDEEAESTWAEKVHLSRFHFQRMFRRLIGEPPGELRRRLRLECAAHALCTTPQAVTEIAFDAGYESLEGFSRAFRRAYGLSPSHYRRIPFPRVHLPSPSNIHYDPLQGQPYQFIAKGVFNMDITDRLIDHDMWLTRRLLAQARELTDEQLDAPVATPQNPLPFESAEGTLREALNRLVYTKEVWLAAVGRPDLKADPEEARHRAHLLYKSLHRLLALPAEIVILPGHASEPVAFDGQALAAPLAQVRQQISLLLLAEDDFVEVLLQHIPATPPNHLRIVELNETGNIPDSDLTDLEAGGNRCAAG